MASRTGKTISGHYVVSIDAMLFNTCTFNPKNLKDGTEPHLCCF